MSEEEKKVEMQGGDLKPNVIAKAKQLYEANREDIDSTASHGFGFARVVARAIKSIASENTAEKEAEKVSVKGDEKWREQKE